MIEITETGMDVLSIVEKNRSGHRSDTKHICLWLKIELLERYDAFAKFHDKTRTKLIENLFQPYSSRFLHEYVESVTNLNLVRLRGQYRKNK